MYLSSKALFAYLIGKINPEAWDAIIPHGPKISVAARDVMASMIIKSVAESLADPKLSFELDSLGRKLYEQGAKGMVAGYDDDDWCPTKPRPWPWPPVSVISDPLPWHVGEMMGMDIQSDPSPSQKYFGGVLLLMSETVSHKEIGGQLGGIARQLINGRKK